MNSIIRGAARLIIMRPHLFEVPKRMAHNFPLTYDLARERLFLVLRLYDKIDPNKLTLDSKFTDLGLCSLDMVEVVQMIEDEFGFEIPMKDAEKFERPITILQYLTDKEEAYKELQDLHQHHHHHHHHGSGHAQAGNNITQKKTFCSWTAKRYFRPREPNRTSFTADPPKNVTIEEIQERVLKVLSKYDKIDSSKLELSSNLVDDLGLDSLDVTECVMEIEEEFAIEIDDRAAEKLLTPAEIAKYIFHKEEARAITTEDRPY